MTRTFRLLFLLLLFVGCDESILHDLDELRANQVQIALSRVNIRSEKSRQGKLWSISVDEAESARALLVIEQSRILKRTLERGSESGGLLQTNDEKSRGYERETSIRAEETLERIPGVLEARVHIYRDGGGRRLLPQSTNGDSASVLLVAEQRVSLPLNDIRSFIGGAFGVKPENISILKSIAGGEGTSGDAPNTESINSLNVSKRNPLASFSFQPWMIGASAAFPVAAVCFLSMKRKQKRDVLEELRIDPKQDPKTSQQSRLRRPFGPEDFDPSPEDSG